MWQYSPVGTSMNFVMKLIDLPEDPSWPCICAMGRHIGEGFASSSFPIHQNQHGGI